MGTPEKKPSLILPKISRQLAYRTLTLVVVVGSLTYGLLWFLKVRSDLGGLETSNTAGWISAVQYLPHGQQAVLISPDGKVHKDSGYVPNSVDRDIVWSPKGNFLYFVSDRVDHNFSLFRWSPDSGKPSEQRTIGTRARTSLKFPSQKGEETDKDAKGLIITGGMVQEFDPTNQSTAQVLPPTQKEITQSKGNDEHGTEGQFEGYYGSLGTSFRLAEWCGDKHYIAAIMRRESGEILIIQEMRQVEGKFPPPRPIVAGEHIDLAVNPVDGKVVYCVVGFQWPDTASAVTPEGTPRKKPFINGIGTCDLQGKNEILIANQGQEAYSSPAVSPDGKGLAIILEHKENGTYSSVGLATLPVANDPTYPKHQFGGDIHEPTWSPDGTHILAAVHPTGKARMIFEIPVDGSPPRNITGEVGDFGFPAYSPQKKGS